ncbi:MAG: hydrogenase maturation protease [Lacunisphaera sp.]
MRPLVDTTLVGEASAKLPPPDPAAGVLVLGVGNLLMGDEGVGVHALRALEDRGAIPGVRLLDGGTGGANLLGEFEGRRAIILIDATRDGSAAGSVRYRHLEQQRIFDLPVGLSAHDFGLKDLFAAAALLDTLPGIHLFTIAVETVRPMCTELSPPVAAVLPDMVARVHALAGCLARTA